MTFKQSLRLYIKEYSNMKQILTILFLMMSGLAFSGEIIVSEGESLHDALRQAREWRRTNDPRCEST